MEKYTKSIVSGLIVLAFICTIGLTVKFNQVGEPDQVIEEITEPTENPMINVEPETEPDVEIENDNEDEDDRFGVGYVEYEFFENDTVLCTYVDEYLYVTASVLNVRVGPGTSYDVVSGLERNTTVHRIGICDNGWSKIELGGEEFYVYSDYLSYGDAPTSSTATSNTSNDTTPNISNDDPDRNPDTVEDEVEDSSYLGRLSIPSVGVDVAVYDDYTQSTVDNEDSAAYLYGADIYGQDVIADHVHQGFSGIKKAVPGSTYAYLNFGTHTKSYVCTKNFIGYNTGPDLVDLNGQSISGQNNGGLCMYTCNSDGTITITFWQPA
jgi:hypothetical protein